MHFNLVLNSSVMIARAAMRVYMFHSCQFHAPLSPFLYPYENITLHDVRPPFNPLMHPTDGEFDSDTRLAPTYSVESDSLELSYPYVIRLTSDSSSSSSSAAS